MHIISSFQTLQHKDQKKIYLIFNRLFRDEIAEYSFELLAAPAVDDDVDAAVDDHEVPAEDDHDGNRVDGRDLPAEDVHVHLPLGGVVGPHLGLEAVPHDVVPAAGILGMYD